MSKPKSAKSSSVEAPEPSAPEPSRSDVVLIHGRTPDGKGLQVIRRRDEAVELGCVRPLEEGKPLAGDVVKLVPRPEFPLLCDVETQFSVGPAAAPETKQRAAAPRAERKGPPRVTSEAYRNNWDAIYNRGSKSTLVN